MSPPARRGYSHDRNVRAAEMSPSRGSQIVGSPTLSFRGCV